MRMGRPSLAGALLLLGFGLPPLAPGRASAQEAHALIVVGIGGEERYRDRFHEWASTLHDALVERHGLAPERVTYLGERPDMDPERIDGGSRREDVMEAFGTLARTAGPEDRVMIVIIGHGTTAGSEAMINLPGPDVSATEVAGLLDALPTQRVALVNTASSSGPWVEALAGPNRTIITATRSAQERNETWFGRHFVEALAGDAADLDKDGAVSLFEAYEYARSEVARQYQEQGLLLTEHALLSDDGDRRGSAAPDVEAGEGRLARAFVLGWVGAPPGANLSDPVLRGLLQERAALNERIEALRSRRADMEPEAYDQALEELLIELALKDRDIRQRGGGAP